MSTIASSAPTWSIQYANALMFTLLPGIGRPCRSVWEALARSRPGVVSWTPQSAAERCLCPCGVGGGGEGGDVAVEGVGGGASFEAIGQRVKAPEGDVEAA